MDAGILRSISPGGEPLSRRDMLRWSVLLGAAAAAAPAFAQAPALPGTAAAPDDRKRSPKRYPVKKSINLWCFPYPKRMTLEECFRLAREAGFDAVEVNYDLEGDLSPRAGEKDVRAIGDLARKIGLEISGLCSFLFWPYPMSASDPAKRARSHELAEGMIRAAHWIGTGNLLVVPGAVSIPWIKDAEVVPAADVDRRAREGIAKLLPLADKFEVSLNVENIFFNGYLMSPEELAAFVDSFRSPRLNVHFDTGNVMPFQFPEDWIPALGKRIRNVHFKEFCKEGTDLTLTGFRPLLDGSTNWPAVMDALDAAGYRGYVTFEYFRPYPHYPEALIYHASDSMDRILGRT